MCGVYGIVAFDRETQIDASVVRTLTRTLAHRGPDDEGIWCDGSSALGFRRLSIIDLTSNGNQPFVNEAGDVRLVCNGEIYNHRPLRAALIKAGHRFRSESDCEVCLHAYEEYGLEFARHLNGMFAMAVVDQRNERLVLVRDRLGIKPLYYRTDDKSVRFASELKALAADPAITCDIDRLALNLYLVRGAVPAPYSIYRGIGKLAPAEMICVDLRRGRAGVKSLKYWQLPTTADRSRSASSLAEELATLLADAVAAHTMSDVPIGVFFSGGLDSATVLALMQRTTEEAIDTFTVGFDDDHEDESPVARELARDWRVGHHEVRVGRGDLGLLDTVMRTFDEPFGDSSAIPTYAVSALARKSVKVVLCGDGGDELFGGYISGTAARRIERACRAPEYLRTLGASLLSRVAPAESLKRLALPTWLLLASLRDRVFDRHRANVLQPGWRVPLDVILETYQPLRDLLLELEPLNAYLAALLLQYLPDDILTKVDRMSSAHSIEARVPLLDHRVVELAARIPPELKLKGPHSKHILRRAMAARLPESVLTRDKRGFGVPLSYLEGSACRERLEELRTRCRAIEEVINFSDMERWDSLFTWRVLCLASWLARQ